MRRAARGARRARVAPSAGAGAEWPPVRARAALRARAQWGAHARRGSSRRDHNNHLMAKPRKPKVAKVTKPSKALASTAALAPEDLAPADLAPKAGPAAAAQPSTALPSLDALESAILNATTPAELVPIIRDLTSTLQDQIFDQYKAKVREQLAANARTIEELERQLAARDAATPPPPALYKSPIRRRTQPLPLLQNLITQDQLSNELETIGTTLDMLELLTGLRITNYEEDALRLHFDIAQLATTDPAAKDVAPGLSILYRLTILKDHRASAEINYVPTFMAERTRNSERLREVLPEYFCDNLTFPYNTLSQFYNKINRALNKGVRT